MPTLSTDDAQLSVAPGENEFEEAVTGYIGADNIADNRCLDAPFVRSVRID